MKQFKCDQCESVATHVVERDETCRVKGEVIVVHGGVRLCDACGERVFDRTLDSAIFQQAFEVYRTRHLTLQGSSDIPTPLHDEITAKLT